MNNPFALLDIETLKKLKEDYTLAVRKLAVGVSYSIDGRTFTRANLPEVKQTLSEVSLALAAKEGRIHVRSSKLIRFA